MSSVNNDSSFSSGSLSPSPSPIPTIPQLPFADGINVEYSERYAIATIPKEDFQWFSIGQKEKQLALLYDYLPSLADAGEIQHLKVDMKWMEFFENIKHKCEVLTLGTDEGLYTDYDLQLVPDVGKVEISRLLHNVDVKRGLALVGPKELRTDHHLFYETDWLMANHCQYLKMSQLENMKNRIIKLNNIIFTDEEINSLFKKLKNGTGNENLQVMTLSRECDEKWMPHKLFINLKAIMVRPQTYHLKEKDPNVFLADFLPVKSRTIQIGDAFEFKKNNEIRVTVEIKQSELRVFVWSREGCKRRSEAVNVNDVKRSHRCQN